jgi:hypothetical protein
MAGHGVPWDRQIVANVENGKRHNITVNELLALARVLSVAPVNLLIPQTDESEFHVTPTESVSSAEARAWFSGQAPLPGTDLRMFRTEVPLNELVRR